MLFHPYEPPKLFGRRIRFLQGAVPKNKDRLAVAMGRTVGNKLLTPDDISRTLSEPAFRNAFDERLGAFVHSVFDERRGSVTTLLPAQTVADVRAVLMQGADTMLLRLDAYLASDAFRVSVERWIVLVRDEVEDRPIGELLTEERQAALSAAAAR